MYIYTARLLVIHSAAASTCLVTQLASMPIVDELYISKNYNKSAELILKYIRIIIYIKILVV